MECRGECGQTLRRRRAAGGRLRAESPAWPKSPESWSLLAHSDTNDFSEKQINKELNKVLIVT